jgi:tetratricopeptide (TPR) repeat protein
MTATKEHQPTFFEQAEAFFRKYRNVLLGVLAAILIVVLYLWYTNNKKGKDQEEAQQLMDKPTLWFTSGQDSIALYGDFVNPGFLEIIDKYGKTASGNLANYYAGSIYLRTGEFQNAIKHLDAVKPKSQNVGANAKLLLGHAYAQAGDSLKAAEAYSDATTMTDNELLTPMYLKVAGDYHLVIGKYADAEKFYRRLQDDYPTSTEGRDAERFIALARQKQL